jgi:porin
MWWRLHHSINLSFDQPYYRPLHALFIMSHTLRTILTAALLGFSINATAEGDAYAKETLTGDWGGMRSASAAKGFEWEGALKIDSLRNRGARRNGTRSVNHLDIRLSMDFDKAFGWEGGSGLINIDRDGGYGLNAEHVQSLMGVSNLEVPSPTTTRFLHAWVQQSLLDERLSILAGIYPVDSEFQVMDSAGVFLKPEYGPTAEFSQTRGPSIFNNAAFGIRSRLSSSDKSLYAQWALMDGIPNDPNQPKRTRIRFDDNDGAFNMVEIGWLPEAGNDAYKGHAKLAFGLWGYTVRENDQLDVANIDAGNRVDPARKQRQHGAYLFGERTVLRMGEDRFISLFGRYSKSDGDSTSIQNAISAGVHVKGPFASRSEDVLGLAWSRAGVSSKWRAAQTVGTDDAEAAIELTYRFVITPWLAIQPSYQRIVNPGAIASVSDSRILGMRLDFAL